MTHSEFTLLVMRGAMLQDAKNGKSPSAITLILPGGKKIKIKLKKKFDWGQGQTHLTKWEPKIGSHSDMLVTCF